MLNNDEKVKVLENILRDLKEIQSGNSEAYCCLCELFFHHTRLADTDYKQVFKDFRRVNAVMFANGKFETYWWSILPYDCENRIKFISWMIERIQTGQEGRYGN